MLLKNLISNLKPEVGALKIKGISFDSRSIKKGDLFVSIKGKKFESDASGLLAVCIQHEIDHLDGKIFVDYLSDMKRSKIEKGLIKQKQNNSFIKRGGNPYIK